MTISRPGMFHPLYHLESIFLARRVQHIRKKGSLPAYILQVLAGCFQHSLTHYLLSHIFSWVKGFSSLFCSVPIFFFSIVKNPSSHTRKSIYVACTSTPQLALLLHRGADRAVIFRHSRVNRQQWGWLSIPRGRYCKDFTFLPTQTPG